MLREGIWSEAWSQSGVKTKGLVAGWQRRGLLVKNSHRRFDDLFDTSDVSSRQTSKSVWRPSGKSWDEDDSEVRTELDERGESIENAGDQVAVPISQTIQRIEREAEGFSWG